MFTQVLSHAPSKNPRPSSGLFIWNELVRIFIPQTFCIRKWAYGMRQTCRSHSAKQSSNHKTSQVAIYAETCINELTIMTEKYVGRLQKPLEFDPTVVLPPDRVSEYMGELAYFGAMWSHFLSDDPSYRANVLVPGIGSGIIAASLLSQRARYIARHAEFAEFPIHIEAFDVDARAVEVAQENLTAYLESDDSATVSVYQADWHDQSTWDRVGQQQYHGVIMNPPYLTPASLKHIRSGYEKTPVSALMDTSGYSTGLGAYATLLPQVAKIIEVAPGSIILGRFAVGDEAARMMQEMLISQFAEQVQESIAHINIKSFQSNMVADSAKRRSYSAFLVEPVGMIDKNDGNPVNLYWVPEYIDARVRSRLIPNRMVSASFSTSSNPNLEHRDES